ncbi:MerR family transcriptional regulator [Streptomyces bobili]|uniref:MerR family transcriptional regulator n=1 Tax=Streptomyces bobili TaxID=67280 RepID=UPI00344177B6
MRDLVARESGCCSFFTFTVSPGPGEIRLCIEVDAAHEAVLDAVQERAAAAAGRDVPRGTGLRSGQVAAAAGVNIQTLRYYERRGLLAEPDRSPGGHRIYNEEAVTALRVIKAAQRLGFTLEEVAELLKAGRHGRPAPGLQDRAAAKLAEVDAKIADLTTIRTTLAAAVEAGCDDLTVCASNACCPIPFSDLAEENHHAGPC